jgi:hypothetical protein
MAAVVFPSGAEIRQRRRDVRVAYNKSKRAQTQLDNLHKKLELVESLLGTSSDPKGPHYLWFPRHPSEEAAAQAAGLYAYRAMNAYLADETRRAPAMRKYLTEKVVAREAAYAAALARLRAAEAQRSELLATMA